MINEANIQDLIGRSAALIETAALLPNPAINREYIREQADVRARLLSSLEAQDAHNRLAEQRVAELNEWRDEVGRSLHALLSEGLAEFGSTIRRSSFNEYEFYICAPVWDKWKNGVSDLPETIATIQAITSYESKHGAQSWKRITHRGKFLEVTINGKSSRHTSPNLPKLAHTLLTAVSEKAETIKACDAAKAEKEKKANSALETFGAVLPLEVSTQTHTYGTGTHRTKFVEHTYHTNMKPIGAISSGSISPSYKTPGTWDVTLSLRELDETTAKTILDLLAKSTK